MATKRNRSENLFGTGPFIKVVIFSSYLRIENRGMMIERASRRLIANDYLVFLRFIISLNRDRLNCKYNLNANFVFEGISSYFYAINNVHLHCTVYADYRSVLKKLISSTIIFNDEPASLPAPLSFPQTSKLLQ